MPAPLSPDIRNRFQVLHREGLSAREIGRRLLISAATAVRFADRLRRTGDLAPAVNSRRQGHGLCPARVSLQNWWSKIPTSH
jgi:transposase